MLKRLYANYKYFHKVQRNITEIYQFLETFININSRFFCSTANIYLYKFENKKLEEYVEYVQSWQ